MQPKAKIFTLSLIAIVGLLLGGNARAQSNELSPAETQVITAQVQQTQQKISELIAQICQLQGQPAAAVTTTKVSLSQAQLDAIEAQVKSVRAKYEALKVQVQVFVAVRDIQQKINALTSQMPAASAAAAPAPTIGAPAGQAQAEAATTTALTNRQEIEAKIAATKQQIAELTQELQTMKGAGQPTGAVVSQPTAGTGAVSEQKETTTKIETPSKPVQTQTSQPQTQPKGFWQSIADFFKKLFTF